MTFAHGNDNRNNGVVEHCQEAAAVKGVVGGIHDNNSSLIRIYQGQLFRFSQATNIVVARSCYAGNERVEFGRHNRDDDQAKCGNSTHESL